MVVVSSEDPPGFAEELFPSSTWKPKAEENIETWGVQSVETLLLAMQEELGELTQAHLEYQAEDGDRDRVRDELDDLGALCIQLSWVLNPRFTDEDGEVLY